MLSGPRRAAAVVAAVGLIAAVQACAKAENATPADVAMQFYVTLEISGVRDLPEPRAVLAIEPYVLPEVSAQLRAAYDKKGVGGGNPFSSLFEGHSSYGAKQTIMRGDTALVVLAFTNTDQKPAVMWSDTLVLVKPQNAWRIADIRYGTTWEFGYQGSLTSVLRAALAP